MFKGKLGAMFKGMQIVYALIAAVVVLGVLDARFTAVIIVIGLIVLAATGLMRRHLKNLNKQVSAHDGRVSGFLQETMEKLLAAFLREPDCIHGASHDGVRGNPCLFPREFFPELMQLQGDRGGAAVIRRYPERLRHTEVPEEELFDCDTPEALAICRKKATKKSEKYAKNCLTSI